MKMELKNIMTCVKTTLIGLLLIGASLYYLIEKDGALLNFAVVLASGIALLFAPDTLISGLKSFIRKNKNKEL